MEKMIASFLCADLQIRSEPSADDAAYLASWLRLLRGDRRAIFTAASKPEEAAKYLKTDRRHGPRARLVRGVFLFLGQPLEAHLIATDSFGTGTHRLAATGSIHAGA